VSSTGSRKPWPRTVTRSSPGFSRISTTRISRVDVPTLVIHGKADRILPIGASGIRTAKLIAGARLAVVKDGPHCITWTHADEVNRELADFLATTS